MADAVAVEPEHAHAAPGELPQRRRAHGAEADHYSVRGEPAATLSQVSYWQVVNNETGEIKRDAPAFLLESVEGGQRLARYSFIGSEPFLDIVLEEDEATIVSSDAVPSDCRSCR